MRQSAPIYRLAYKHTYLVASAGSSWLVSDSDTRSIELSASPVPSPAACKYSTVFRAEACSSLVRRLCLATASMCGDRSTPITRRAKGKVCASLRVDSPVEQPMSRMSFGSGPYSKQWVSDVCGRACVCHKICTPCVSDTTLSTDTQISQ